MKQKLVKAIKDYILDSADEQERQSTIHELKRYKENFRREPDYNWYNYGNILPYYYQIRDFYKKNGIKQCSKNDDRLLADFKYNLRIAIDEIIRENREVK